MLICDLLFFEYDYMPFFVRSFSNPFKVRRIFSQIIRKTLFGSNTYHFSLFEYNGSLGKIYKRPGETTSLLDIDTFNYSISVKSWPNPSDSYFNIKLTTNNNFNKTEIFIYDINGKQVHYNTFNPGDVYRFGKELAGGIYIVKVIQAERMKIKRLIKF